MSLVKYILDVIGLLDDPKVDGDKVHGFFKEKGLDKYMVINVERIKGDKGSTDFIKIIIPGTNGKSKGGNAPTLGVIGRLGGVGARPLIKGLVSDADGAIIALAVAYKLADMVSRGDELVGGRYYNNSCMPKCRSYFS